MNGNDLALASLLTQQSKLNVKADEQRTAAPTITQKLDSSKVAIAPQPVKQLSAEEFREAIKNAGKRPFTNEKGEVVMQRVKDCVRGDQIAAINGYVGYNKKEDFASQLMNAESKARQAVNPVKHDGLTRQEKRRLDASVKGWVKGLPNAEDRMLTDLQSRERLIVEAICGFEDKWSKSTDSQERAQLKGMANVERSRLESVRKQMEKLTK